VRVHQKPRRDSPLGQMQQGMLDKPAPLFGSKVMLRCPHCGRGTRPKHVMGGDGRRVRTCRKCDKQID
jgi:large subunit ribosomal protein L24